MFCFGKVGTKLVANMMYNVLSVSEATNAGVRNKRGQAKWRSESHQRVR